MTADGANSWPMNFAVVVVGNGQPVQNAAVLLTSKVLLSVFVMLAACLSPYKRVPEHHKGGWLWTLQSRHGRVRVSCCTTQA